MPIYFAWFTTALLSVGGDTSNQNLPQSGRLLYCVINAYHHLSQSEIGALAQGIVEMVISIGGFQGLKPLIFGFILCRL